MRISDWSSDVCSSDLGRTREAAGYDFAERAGKLDAQREVGHDGTRNAARIGEQRRQSENFGFAEGAEAAGVSTREADIYGSLALPGRGHAADIAIPDGLAGEIRAPTSVTAIPPHWARAGEGSTAVRGKVCQVGLILD